MSGQPDSAEGFSLARWSRRKREAASRQPSSAPGAPLPPSPAAERPLPAPPSPVAPAPSSTDLEPPTASGAGETRPAKESLAAVAPLPPVESLRFDSDFTGFMQPDVEPSLQRAALKKLFADPRFNVMDGLDTYIDDYSKPDPLPSGMLEQLAHTRYLFNPPATAVDAAGHVVDVVAGEASEPGIPAEPNALVGEVEASPLAQGAARSPASLDEPPAIAKASRAPDDAGNASAAMEEATRQ